MAVPEITMDVRVINEGTVNQGLASGSPHASSPNQFDAVFLLGCEEHFTLNSNNLCEPCPAGMTGWACQWPRT